MKRNRLIVYVLGWLIFTAIAFMFFGKSGNSIPVKAMKSKQLPEYRDVVSVIRESTLEEAKWAMEQLPVTVTSSYSPRSAGGLHDFYSEGDYWWPNPEDPDGPYIQRDGMSNPDNFVAHREAMIRFSRIVGVLAAAYRITGDTAYVSKAFDHLEAWFVEENTRMNPSLEYAQAIKGKVTGRGIGIIDTIHLMEVAQGLSIMENAPNADSKKVKKIKKWFEQYLVWLITHQYGKDESIRKNNHGTCYFMQVASFAKITQNTELLDTCRKQFKEVLLPQQMANDGSFPLELERTKPYGYSLFNLDAMVTLVQVLSEDENPLWKFKTDDGQGIHIGIDYLFPYVKDKSVWPYSPDVMYWNDWPVAQPFLVFGAMAYGEKEWFEVWAKLDHNPKEGEVLRNLPIRNPIIWLEP